MDETTKELIAIKNLLILQLYSSNVPPLDIAKAAGMSPNKLYEIVSTKSAKKKQVNKEQIK